VGLGSFLAESRAVTERLVRVSPVRVATPVSDPATPSEAAYDLLRSMTGIGPCAADKLLRLLGHYDRLGLDSWCRARFLKLYPRTRKTRFDAAIGRRYAPCAPYSGLAMWLDLTRTWHEPGAEFP
jgi:hypothetical protein